MAPTNALLIGSISADDANACLRCRQKNAATPLSYCSPGTYTLRYRRSMPSTSSVTCLRKMSATLRGRLMAGSGRWWSLEDLLPARRAIGSDAIASRVVHSAGALLPFFSTTTLHSLLVQPVIAPQPTSAVPGRNRYDQPCSSASLPSACLVGLRRSLVRSSIAARPARRSRVGLAATRTALRLRGERHRCAAF